MSSCPFHQKLGVKYAKPLVIIEYLGLAQTAPTNQNFVDAIMSIESEEEEGDQAQCDAT